METKWCAIVLLNIVMISMVKTEDSYYMSETVTTWPAARSSCDLATPKVSQFYGSLPDVGNITLPEDAKIWLGYAKIYHDFENIGCVQVNTLTIEPPLNVLYDPGECFAACKGGKLLGVSYRYGNCYCLQWDTSIIDNQRYCTHYCKLQGSMDIPCGGSDERDQRYISLYQEVGVSTSSGDLCRSYNDGTFIWESCSTRHDAVCYGDTIWSTIWSIFRKRQRWRSSIDTCLTEQRYPIFNITANASLLSSTRHVWTAMFKRMVMHEASDVVTSDAPGMLFGYLDYRGEGQGLLKFTDNVNDTGVALCRRKPDGVEGKSSAGAYIGMTIGLVLLVILVLGGILYLRKWKKRTEESVGDSVPGPILRLNPLGTAAIGHQLTETDIDATTYDRISRCRNDEFPDEGEAYMYIQAENMNQSDDMEGQYAQRVYHVLGKNTPSNHNERTDDNTGTGGVYHILEESSPSNIDGRTDDNVGIDRSNVAYGLEKDGIPNQSRSGVATKRHNEKLPNNSEHHYANGKKQQQQQQQQQQHKHPQDQQKQQNKGNVIAYKNEPYQPLTLPSDEHEYDVSGNVRGRPSDSDNVYNTLQSADVVDGDNVYDCTTGQPRRRYNPGNPSEDMYSSTTSAESDGPESTYDHTGVSQRTPDLLVEDPLYSKATFQY